MALLVSAILVPALRVLHSLQALIYVAVIVRAHRESPWGFGAGVSSGIVWNALNILVTHLIQAGAAAFWLWLRSGHVTKPAALMVALVGSGDDRRSRHGPPGGSPRGRLPRVASLEREPHDPSGTFRDARFAMAFPRPSSERSRAGHKLDQNVLGL